ncbi:hypothetical protein MJ547_04475, partial [Burkholderia gladioli]
MDRPAIPKKLASRIVAAQNKVVSARDGIVNYDVRMTASRKELDEFEADPEGYARRRYGRNPVDSYPVQTRIERQREDLDYRTRNLPRKHDELADADEHLAAVEAEVRVALMSMRPNTPGRVPWPSPLPSFQQHREEAAAARARAHARAMEQHAATLAALEEHHRKVAEALDKENEIELAAWRERFAALPPEQQAESRRMAKALVTALQDGTITFADVLEALRARQRVAKPQ